MCQRGAAPAAWLAAVVGLVAGASLAPPIAFANTANPRHSDSEASTARRATARSTADARVPSLRDEVTVVTLEDGSQMAFVPRSRLSASVARIDARGVMTIRCGDEVATLPVPLPAWRRTGRVPVCE